MKVVLDYPKLALFRGDGAIVLFNGENSGTVLKSKHYKIGHYGEDWISVNNEDV